MGNDLMKTDMFMTSEEINILTYFELKLITENFNIIRVDHITQEQSMVRNQDLIKGKCKGRMKVPKQIINKLKWNSDRV